MSLSYNVICENVHVKRYAFFVAKYVRMKVPDVKSFETMCRTNIQFATHIGVVRTKQFDRCQSLTTNHSADLHIESCCQSLFLRAVECFIKFYSNRQQKLIVKNLNFISKYIFFDIHKYCLYRIYTICALK